MRRSTALVAIVLIVSAMACASQRGISDDHISADIHGRLDKAFSGSVPGNLVVTVNDGVVTLSGFVHSEDERRKVNDAVSKVNGVRSVIDRMTIAP